MIDLLETIEYMQYLLEEKEFKALKEAEESHGEPAREQMVKALVDAGSIKCWHDDETLYPDCGSCPLKGYAAEAPTSTPLCPRPRQFSK